MSQPLRMIMNESTVRTREVGAVIQYTKEKEILTKQ